MPQAEAELTSSTNEIWDVVVIGAGVVGCATARRLALNGARTLIVEKAPDILAGASKGNSGILHTGFDAPPGSLEQKCIAAGYEEYLTIRERLNLPLLETGALVLAWNAEQEARLDSLIEQAQANGVHDVTRLTRTDILKREPELSDAVVAGFSVPREFVIDPWSAPYAYLLQAIENGASCRRGTQVTGGAFDGEYWSLETGTGLIRCRTVINCTGLYGDEVDRCLIGETAFTIRPRKGQFVVFDKAAAGLVNAILLPVPTEKTKGVVICRTSYGNLLVGPTAEDQESREDASVDRDTLAMLRARGIEMVPRLADCAITATYAGLRPATDEKDYRICAYADRHYISVGGIRSTGLSGALGIAWHVAGLCAEFGEAYELPAKINWPAVATITEYGERDWAQPGNGGVVCHCELVTRREIEEALAGPLGANSLGGLKRRTRVTMGRCQGFYCLGALSDMTRGRLDQSIADAQPDR